jgi:hypothetical protein
MSVGASRPAREEPSPHVLRQHEARLGRMYADRDLVGDLLLFGIVFARAVDLGTPSMNTLFAEAADMIYGSALHSVGLAKPDEDSERPFAAATGQARVLDVLESDIRRTDHGGILERHLPEVNWPEFYWFLDPDWTDPAGTGIRLQLLTGGIASSAPRQHHTKLTIINGSEPDL